MVSVDQGLRGLAIVLGVLSGGFLVILLYLTARLASGIIYLQNRPNILWTKDVTNEAIPRPEEFETVAQNSASVGAGIYGRSPLSTQDNPTTRGGLDLCFLG